MKKIISIIMAVAMLSVCLCGCGNPGTTAESNKSGIKIITTIFPEYDWVKSILGDNPGNADVIMLLDSGIDLHNYQPSAEDILNVSTCDLFVYVGGESDEWVDEVLQSAQNPNLVAVNLLEVLGNAVKEEELVEGMEEEEEESEEGVEYDEHVWMSLRLTRKSCKAIEEALEKVLPEEAERFRANLGSYDSKLDALDKQYEEMVKGSRLDTIVVLDRYPFRYLAEDYKLKYSAAFLGCSAETEASFETVKFLADKVKALDSKAVLIIENSDGKLAKTVLETAGKTDAKIEVLDSMQSCGKDLDYLKTMTGNLEKLKAALS